MEQLKTSFCLIKNIKQSVLQWPALWFPYLDQSAIKNIMFILIRLFQMKTFLNLM